ncbi:hypothetical protein PoB_004045000 [Plakobranchus ocellatus]|uniref:DUF7869 domain-containing protein n=1 Tax=Plakobranchus ocellatus TaxID=259542 RepID=A0AAV4B019_9GAST|nr:hypothetical protein PoB_004045000 [Plakobranchus ocellatus]
MYYRCWLQVHIFTFHNIMTREGFCYVWDETQGDLSSEAFASIQVDHFRQYVEDHPAITVLIIWSDNCCYQNKNTTLSNAFSSFQRKRVVIIHQYLLQGHTQMECDSMHSKIERKITNDIFLPHNYCHIMKSALRIPKPFDVKQLFHQDFKKLNAQTISSIRPGKKVGDATVHDLKALKYLPDGTVLFKVSYDDDTWENLPCRFCEHEEIAWIQLFEVVVR